MKALSFHRPCLLVLTLALPAYAQSQPVLQWERSNATIGNSRSTQRFLKVRPNLYACIGAVSTRTPTLYRYTPYLTLINGTGVVQQTYFTNTALGTLEFPADATYNNDGTFTIWGGHTDVDASGQSLGRYLFMMVVDTLGQVRWRQNYTQFSNNEEAAYTMLATPDGYLLALSSPGIAQYYTVPALLKVDKQGGFQWYRRYPNRWGLGGDGTCQQLSLCRDGSYLCVGTSGNMRANQAAGIGSFQGADYLLTQVAPWGDTIRTALLGRPTQHEEGLGVQQTRDGGFLLRGGYASNPQTSQGELVKLDSLWRMQWRTNLAAAATARYQSCGLGFAYETTGGDVVTGGTLLEAATLSTPTEGYLVGLAGATGAVAWQQRRRWNNAETGLLAVAAEADGSARVLGNAANPASSSSPNFYLARYQNMGAPYVPDYCTRQPPQALAALAPTAPDSLVASDISLAGPRYAVISLWDWDFGDGSPHGRTARVRHRYAAPPPFGTAVRLTVTNNLGCTSTAVEYPWGGPLGTRAAAAGVSLSVYPNPAHDQLTLVLSKGTALDAGRPVQLLDVLGRVVRVWPAGAGPLALGGVVSGPYVLQAWVNGRPVSQRVLVE